MANKIICRDLNDWSDLDGTDPFFAGLDISNEKNFGIHTYNGKLCTSGYVGVGRIYGMNGRPLRTNGKEHVAIISSKYHMDPWVMLEKVMTDDEYDDYVKELEDNKKYLFRIFYDQPVIKLDQDQSNNADILYALSFITQCYGLCKKGIKKSLIRQEENYVCKIRGRIDVKNNIRKNASKGRNDRFYCKYIDFTTDTIENRILKATLVRCKKILEQKFEIKSEIMSRLFYCMNSFKGVKSVTIKDKDFNNASTTGLYIYYKPLIKQARAILCRKYQSYLATDGNSVSKSVYVIPYMINMETVFEFYVRTVLRKNIDDSKYYIEKYSKKIFIQKGVTVQGAARSGIHLMQYCIPDVIICDKNTDEPVIVLDAKYKRNDVSDRADSHQLLSYALLTGADKCGFVMPDQQTRVKQMGVQDFIEIETPLAQSLKYYELLIGNVIDSNEINKLF